MKLIPISAEHFHCDGGALFGVIPKVLWSKVYPADENNFTKLALRCLLIDQGDRKILIETGIGNHYSEKHLKNNGVTGLDQLEKSLSENGYLPHDITDVFLTHLHWNHATGAVKNENGELQLRFPNATHWCSQIQWEHSKISNPRESAAFHAEVLEFLMATGQLNLVEKKGELFPRIEVRFFDGHTPGQMLPFIQFEGKTVVYTSDLVPTAANVPLLWVAAYDLNPVEVMQEKEKFLEEAAEKNYILFFEHDFYHETATIEKGEKGFRVKEINPVKLD
ncbi:Glyoxylase, beta-lactamase superfamily II [Tangfeifania diversioriginum]|uniref:Glyoxylase, beta-lactamase superfamily II n=2 Tax=Bacteroidia TaxID=200643 RepID=A0A1M6KL55_9BACT|nr:MULTISPECIES: MBL fold metallo-hydrolase [Bacteroidia]SHG02358.1 Glyoxylase, beta-lactamase superfamily II [Bacteroides faecichinchillae]SHJ59600.1 Glyoxylase, beta-lactamase superfamily II [Tangfeifania diversioriginum]